MTVENEEPVSPLPLPLKAVGGEIFGKGSFLVAKVTSGPGGTSIGSERDRCKARADAIVTACNAYPDLKARIVALETENRRLREALEKIVAPSSSSNPRWWRDLARRALQGDQNEK